jgi:hypothetical protein
LGHNGGVVVHAWSSRVRTFDFWVNGRWFESLTFGVNGGVITIHKINRANQTPRKPSRPPGLFTLHLTLLKLNTPEKKSLIGRTRGNNVPKCCGDCSIEDESIVYAREAEGGVSCACDRGRTTVFDATHTELVNIPGQGNRLQCRVVKEKYPVWVSFFPTVKNILFEVYVLPVILILFINSVILFQILRTQNEAATSGMTSKNRTKSKSRDMKATISLLGISAMYLVPMSPSTPYKVHFVVIRRMRFYFYYRRLLVFVKIE